jgi:hypothetical protein
MQFQKSRICISYYIIQILYFHRVIAFLTFFMTDKQAFGEIFTYLLVQEYLLFLTTKWSLADHRSCNEKSTSQLKRRLKKSVNLALTLSSVEIFVFSNGYKLKAVCFFLKHINLGRIFEFMNKLIFKCTVHLFSSIRPILHCSSYYSSFILEHQYPCNFIIRDNGPDIETEIFVSGCIYLCLETTLI